jgi:hypothetical protein
MNAKARTPSHSRCYTGLSMLVAMLVMFVALPMCAHVVKHPNADHFWMGAFRALQCVQLLLLL